MFYSRMRVRETGRGRDRWGEEGEGKGGKGEGGEEDEVAVREQEVNTQGQYYLTDGR